MSIQSQRPIKDVRLNLANSYYSQDDSDRTPVSILEERYAPFVKKFVDEKTLVLKLEKLRGDKVIVKTIVTSDIVRRKLNRSLPKIKRLSENHTGFMVGDFADLMGVHRAAAHKYLNILLAGKLIVSDGKHWGAKYQWNSKNKSSCL